MSGLLQKLHVESDSNGVLRTALELPSWHKKGATHYRVKRETDGSDKLCLMWAHDEGANVQLLPFPITTPEAMFHFACEWLRTAAKYPTEQPDTDGDVSRGWSVTADDFYSVAEIKAEWIVYSK